MKQDPIRFIFRIEEFDRSKLPIDEDTLESNPSMLETAVLGYYEEQFREIGGDSKVVIADGVVTVHWVPDSDLSDMVEHAISLLQRGDSQTAIPMLQSLRQRVPDDPVILYNLGMALSDLGLGDKDKLNDAMSLLKRLVAVQPDSSRAWNALGVAHERNGDPKAAEDALRRSLQLNPEDGYAHRNLGSIVAKRSLEEGLPYLKRAAELLPDDQASLYGYGLALMQSGNAVEADPVLRRAIETDPLSPVAELARNASTRMAHENMRSATRSAPRMDAILYCLAAMQLFEKSPEKRQPVAFEISMLGKQGLDINDPAQKYVLKSLPGMFSGMQLVCYMYVGIKQIDPTLDPGIDLSGEYQHARQLMDGDMA